ncbi:unnamed protein product [Phytomonas sp. EM1]|nr:unnamed protein product [Phytomonas sp. EM1]|eukprot:CCW62021.1 unnamed protein product [Phytomonas sp. isolate EM1]
MVLSMSSTPLLSYSTTVRASSPSQGSKQRNVCSLYNGENIQLRVGVNDFQEHWPWSMYVFHTDFCLVNNIPSQSLVPPPEGKLSMHKGARLRQVISVGERTRIAGLEGFQTLVLVGEGSSIEHSVLQCEFDADKHENATDVLPCFVGNPQLRAINLTIQFQIKLRDVILVRSFHVSKAETCDELIQQFVSLRDEEKENVFLVDLLSPLIRCRGPEISVNAFLKGIPLSSDFYAAMPLSIALRMRLPQFIRMVQSYCTYFLEYVGIPAVNVILKVVSILDRLWRQLAVWITTTSKASLPYLFLGFRLLKCTFKGFFYRSSAYECEGSNTDCNNSTTEMGFFVGVYLREGLVMILSSASDALTVVPGLYTIIHWSVDVEWVITKTLIRVVLQGINRMATGVLCPVVQRMWRLLETLCVSLGPLLAMLSSLMRRAYVVIFLRDTYRWLYEQELRLINLELRIITLSMSHAAWVLVFVIRSSGQIFAKSCRHGILVMKWYSSTSLFIHFLLFVMQTVILFVALRNEIRSLIEYQFTTEENEKSVKGSNRGIATNSGGMWPLAKTLTKFRTYQKFKFVNGITLLAKSHYQAFMAYILHHSVLGLLLVGLSVLPFTSRFYVLTLQVAFPWLSSKLFLNFFVSKPSRSQVTMMFGARLVFALFLECTIGDLMRRILKEVFFLLICSTCILLGLWIWKHHRSLLRQIAAVSEKIFSAAPVQAAVVPLWRSEGSIMEEEHTSNHTRVTRGEAKEDTHVEKGKTSGES